MPRLRLPRTTGFLLAAATVDSCMSGGGLVLALWLPRDLGADARLIGLLFALPSAVYVCGTILLGHLADRIGRRRMTILGVLLMVLSTVPMAWATAPWQLALPLAGRAIGSAMYWPALSGWISKGAQGAQLPRRMAAYNLGWSSGNLLGNCLGGAVFAGLGGPHALLAFAAGLAWLPLLLLRLPGLRPGDEPVLGITEPLAPSLPHQRRLAWMSNFAAFFVTSSVRSLFPQYGLHQLGLDARGVSACMAAMSAVLAGLFVYLGLVRPQLAGGGWVRASQFAAALGLLALGTGSLAGAVLGVVTVGAAGGVAFTASFYHSMSGREDTSRQGGINEAVVGSGSMLGAAIGGQAAGWFGPSGPWWLGAAVMATAWLAGLPSSLRQSAR